MGTGLSPSLIPSWKCVCVCIACLCGVVAWMSFSGSHCLPLPSHSCRFLFQSFIPLLLSKTPHASSIDCTEVYVNVRLRCDPHSCVCVGDVMTFLSGVLQKPALNGWNSSAGCLLVSVTPPPLSMHFCGFCHHRSHFRQDWYLPIILLMPPYPPTKLLN